MKSWSSAKGWTPRRIDLAAWRFVLIPAITAAILLTAAFLATFAKADEWLCTGTSICFDRAGIVYSNTDPGQMLVRASDIKTGEGGWIAVDCVARLATANSPVFTIEDGSPLGNLCDTIGGEE